jgi:TatD DNase family protein
MNELSIFDTHCHLADEKYKESNVSEIIQGAEKSGVKYILNVGYNMRSNYLVLEQLKQFTNLFGAVGLHPNDGKAEFNEENLNWIEKQLSNKKIIAIGEIGLDYYREFNSKETQKYWFKKQLELAKKHNLPVCLHIREAFTDAYEIVKEVGSNKGVLHCFTGNWETAEKFINLGFYISFAGNITYQNGKWRERWSKTIEKIPLQKIVIETDAPYLSPVPQRGKINYPQNIVYTLKKLAEIKKMKIEKIAEDIYSNTLRLFELPY